MKSFKNYATSFAEAWRKSPTHFKGSVKYDRGRVSKFLMTFLKDAIAGDRELNDFWSLDVQ